MLAAELVIYLKIHRNQNNMHVKGFNIHIFTEVIKICFHAKTPRIDLPGSLQDGVYLKIRKIQV